jgi:hypothetical protein
MTYFHILVRFGRWEEILAAAFPPDLTIFAATHCMQRYARGVALAATADVEGAEVEATALARARLEPILATRRKHNVTATQVCVVCVCVYVRGVASPTHPTLPTHLHPPPSPAWPATQPLPIHTTPSNRYLSTGRRHCCCSSRW